MNAFTYCHYCVCRQFLGWGSSSRVDVLIAALTVSVPRAASLTRGVID